MIVLGCNPRLADHRQLVVGQLLDAARPRRIATHALELFGGHQHEPITAIAGDGDRLVQRRIAQRFILFQEFYRRDPHNASLKKGWSFSDYGSGAVTCPARRSAGMKTKRVYGAGPRSLDRNRAELESGLLTEMNCDGQDLQK